MTIARAFLKDPKILADRILVLDNGTIAEAGTHQELLARGQVYRNLYDKQFGAVSELWRA